MTIYEKYDQLIRPEVESLIEEVDQSLANSPHIRQYHKGWRVFFSPLVAKPKVLFIGINPGNGQEGVVDLDYHDKDRLEYLQYWDDYTHQYVESTYHLARETKELFQLAGLSDILRTSAVKTNFFFLSTTAERDLYEITSYLKKGPNEALQGDHIFTKAYEWTRKLIDIIEPEVVVCEGKTAYQNVTDCFPTYGEWGDWANHCAYTVIPDKNLVILGYSRTFSRINNKQQLAALLQRFLKA